MLQYSIGGIGALVDKVKDALPNLEDVVDENILDYCNLDKTVRLNYPHMVDLVQESVLIMSELVSELASLVAALSVLVQNRICADLCPLNTWTETC